MKRAAAVLFDMDGVIFDSESAVLAIWRAIAEEQGLAGIDGVFLRCVGTNRQRTREILREAYPELDYARFDEQVRARFLASCGGGRLPLKPGAREILRALKAAGVPLALASSTRTETVKRELSEAGLLDFFDAVVGGDMVSRSKPDPEIFYKACELLGAQPGECAVIEDSHNGIRAARAGGMRALMVPDLLPADAEMREKAEAVFASLFEVERYLLG